MRINRLISFVAALCIGLMSLITISNSVIAAEDNSEYTIRDGIHGVNDSVFYIARPDETSLTVINASQFGLSADAEDNTQAMRNAFDYCRQHPNTKLVIDKGIYHFSPEEDIYLNRLKNTLVDANNAEFIFSTPHYFKIYACDNVEIRNMIVDWDWDTLRLGSLVKIENENDAENTLEIEFTELDEVDADIPLLSFMQYDPVDLVAGVHGSFKIYSPSVDTECIKNVEKVEGRPNVLKVTHSGALDYFCNDEVYLLRHYVYGGQVFNTVEESSNITYNNISIYGACGMGYVFAYGSNHYQIINSYIGLRPGAEDKYRISTTADGIHITNTGGYFRIDNCDLSFCGDDIINIHSNMFYIKSIDESRKIMQGTVPNKIVEPGHTLSFMDTDFNIIDCKATVESITRNGYEATITLTAPLPETISAGLVAYNGNRHSENYVLTNNYVHETKGRGFLLNSDNGLCDGNTFYRTCSQTLQVRTDIPTDRVIEGTGADHIQISNNTFIECNFGGRGDVNADGILSVADAVLLEKWLLGVSDVAIADWKAADLYEDSKLDVFDFCVMRKELLNNSEKQTIEHIAYPFCKSAALYCIDDNNLIYSDNIDLCIAPASLTKLLTASVALNYLSPDTIVTVGSELSLVKPYSSLCLIAKGHRLRLSDLLTGMLMASGNDAAYTVAVTTARAVYPDEYLTDIQAVERFSGLMNDFASKIGMQNSHFTTPEGWDDANQYTTVRDLLTLSEYALSIPVIRDIVGTYQKYIVFVSGENVTWTNTNNILNPNIGS